jgi:hypothetical protein
MELVLVKIIISLPAASLDDCPVLVVEALLTRIVGQVLDLALLLETAPMNPDRHCRRFNTLEFCVRARSPQKSLT